MCYLSSRPQNSEFDVVVYVLPIIRPTHTPFVFVLEYLSRQAANMVVVYFGYGKLTKETRSVDMYLDHG